jgi:hypothetical protein
MLSPGNSIGTITIQGNLVLGSAVAYLVEVSPTQADRTNVTGTATGPCPSQFSKYLNQTAARSGTTDAFRSLDSRAATVPRHPSSGTQCWDPEARIQLGVLFGRATRHPLNRCGIHSGETGNVSR